METLGTKFSRNFDSDRSLNFPEIWPGKPLNSEEYVRKPKSRIAGNDPKFGKIWPEYAAGTLNKVIKNPSKFR